MREKTRLLSVTLASCVLLTFACNLPGWRVEPTEAFTAEETVVSPDSTYPIPTEFSSELENNVPQPNAQPEEPMPLPESFTIPAHQSITIYDGPNGSVKGTFEVELILTIVQEQGEFIEVSYVASNGNTYQAWLKTEEIRPYLQGEYGSCPMVFPQASFFPKTYHAPDGTQPRGAFSIAVLVDASSEPVTWQQAESVVATASDILYRLTGFVFSVVDFRNVEFTVESELTHKLRNQIPGCYLRQTSSWPDGVHIFSFGKDGFARSMGGYSFSVQGPEGYRNHFANPDGQQDRLYVSFGHFGHKYAACGYGGAEQPTSTTSIGGECRNHPGTVCVEKYGYSMCETAVDDLYASTLVYFAASAVVHELMHSFGEGDSKDHFGSPTCNQLMSWPEDRVYDSHEAQLYNVMCPYIYDNFVAGYQP
jgi:hypothetical protein